jgi:hypothetical protein
MLDFDESGTTGLAPLLHKGAVTAPTPRRRGAQRAIKKCSAIRGISAPRGVPRPAQGTSSQNATSFAGTDDVFATAPATDAAAGIRVVTTRY